jgi:hypothetical protein
LCSAKPVFKMVVEREKRKGNQLDAKMDRTIQHMHKYTS